MNVTVNGEVREIPEATATVRALLAQLHYSFPLLIVRINNRLVERAAYDAEPIAAGDHIDVYHLVSGG